MLFIYLPGIVPDLASDLPKTLSTLEKAKILPTLILPDFWHPRILLLHLSLLLILMALHLSPLFLNLKSSFYLSLKISVLDDSGHIPHTHPSSDLIMSDIKILKGND